MTLMEHQPVSPIAQYDALYHTAVRDVTGLDVDEVEQVILRRETLPQVKPAELYRKLQTHIHVDLSKSVFPLGSRTHVNAQGLDRLLGLLRVYTDLRLALTAEDAARWLTTANRHFDGAKPLELLASRTGEQRVRDHLANLLAGNFA